MLGVFFNCSPLQFLKQGFPQSLKFNNSAYWPARPKDPPVPTSPVLGLKARDIQPLYWC